MMVFFIISMMLLWTSLLFFLKSSSLLLNLIFLKMSINFEYSFFFDWVSLFFMGSVSFISLMIILYNYYYMMMDNLFYRFVVLVMLFIVSMFFLISSPNLFSILLGWDGLGLVSYCLVIYYQSIKSYNSGMLTILSNRLGDVFILFSICAMMNFSYMNWFMINMSGKKIWMILICCLVVLGGMTKSAQMPFSAWLPAAMAAPTPVSALVHSSTLVTAGIYLFIRFSPSLSKNLFWFIFLISLMTMILSSFSGFYEMDLKKIVALSTLSQLGFMFSVLGFGMMYLCFFHLILHAFFKSLMFLCVGVFLHSLNNQDSRKFGGVLSRLPLVIIIFHISSLSLSGAPFFSGFFSKDLILDVFFFNFLNILMFLMMSTSIGLTAIYSFRMFFFSLIKWNNNSFSSFSSSYYTLPLMILMLFSLSGGSFLGGFMNLDYFSLHSIFTQKFFIFIYIGLGVITGLLMFKKSVEKKISKFFMTMFFLNIMNELFTKLLKKNNIIFNDKNWFELFSGKMLYGYMKTSSQHLVWWESHVFKFIMFSLGFWLVLFFVFY